MAVKYGAILHAAGSYSLQGISFTCASDGVCTFRNALVPTVDGKTYYMLNQNPQTNPGLYDLDGAMYYVQSDGSLLKNGTWNSLQFDQNGKYTSDNTKIDQKINQIVSTVTDSSMTQERKL